MALPHRRSVSQSPTALLTVLEEARNLGFLGPGPLDAHVDHARGYAQAALTGAEPGGASSTGGEVRDSSGDPSATATLAPGRVLDLGSGGGLPGLVLAEEWPDTEFVLLDAGTRRVAFLRRAVEQCGFDGRVAVFHGRAEATGHLEAFRGRFDVVVARSFGRPAVTAECAAPFLRPGGVLVVSEPPEDPSSETRWSPEGLDRLGLSTSWLIRARFGFRVARQLQPCPEEFSRRDGVPAKRPMF